MDVGAPFPSDAESFEAVEPGERALNDPSVDTQAAAVGCATSSDGGDDPAGPDLVTVDVVVVAAVGEEGLWFASWPAGPAPDGRDGVEEGQKLGDVVAVAAGEDDRERCAVSVGDQVMLGANASSVDWGRARVEPPFSALTWLESTATRDQSSLAAAFSSASSTS